jgi:rhamnogalacturonyl hydrolase YesR
MIKPVRTIRRLSTAGAACAALVLAVLVAPNAQAVTTVTSTVDLPRHSTVVSAAKKAADYYRSTYATTTVTPKNGWSWSTYFQGVQALYRTSGDQRYLNDGLAWGTSNSWGITTNQYETDPNNLKAAQTYFDLHAISSTASLTAADSVMAKDLTTQPVTAYSWADALFMGLPDYPRWAARTANSAYLDKMDALYASTRASLFDPTQGLWFRDPTFIGKQDANGKPIYWARGNGWVIASMALVLQSVPAGDPRRAKYSSMLQTMAARLVQLQGSDGMWRSSLLDAPLYPQPETSSTALIAYALAYGIESKLLDASTYLPAVAKAWQGLTTISLQPSGFVTSCQGAASGPGASYTATSSTNINRDSPPFCVGAFLLAGSAVARLTSSPSTGRPVAYTGQQVGNEATHVDDGDVTTRWSAEVFPKSVTIDLGGSYRLSNAMVVPYLDRAYRYRIQTSTNNTSWTTVVDRTTNTSTGSRLDDFSTGTVTARYARLTVTGVYGVTTDWASIQEFAVYDRFAPRIDLALGRPTSATTSLTAHPATAATDGSSSTWWSSAAVPASSSPQTVLVDLGSIVPIDTVRVFSRSGSGPHHVTVSVKASGTTYTTVASVNLVNAEGPHQVLLPLTSARWIRLTSTSSYSTSTTAVEELEVFRAR